MWLQSSVILHVVSLRMWEHHMYWNKNLFLQLSKMYWNLLKVIQFIAITNNICIQTMLETVIVYQSQYY